MAEFDRTKEGFTNRNKIGIVLTCNDLGFPLRWQVIRGKVRDQQSMTEMLDRVKTLSWAGSTPIVCDRAMGHQGSIADFMASGLRFITATTRQEMESFTKEIPWQTLEAFEPEERGAEKALKKNIAEAGKRAGESGFQMVEDHLYILDLGVKKRKLAFKESVPDESVASCDERKLSGAAALLAKARRFKGTLSRKEVKNQVELAKRERISRRSVCRALETLRLDSSLQEDLLAGHFGYVPQSLLFECAKMNDRRSQKKILDEHALTAPNADHREAAPRRGRSGRHEAELRLVAYFNPEMFVEMRLLAREHQREIETLVSDLNTRLDNPASQLSREKVCSKVASKLKENNLLGVYSVEVVDEKSTEESKRPRFQIRLQFNKEEWRKRRRYDGFVLLVGHPSLPNSAVEIIRFYRQKDRVEKDFQTIKSVVKLRPVWHRTDPKVRAHVTLCMLALLLERSLEHRLKKAGNAMTAPKCFEELKTCHMNLLVTDPDMPPLYTITEPTVAQTAILKSLGVSELLDNGKMAAQIHHR